MDAERPGDAAVLARAAEWERINCGARWVWSDVRATPGQLVRLVIQGKIDVAGEQLGRHLYRLAAEKEKA